MLSRSEAGRIRGLRRRRTREAEAEFLAEGIRVIEDLLAAGLPVHLAVVSPAAEETARGRALVQALAAVCPIRRITDRELTALAGTRTPQGVLAIAGIPRSELADLRIEGPAAVLVLDGVQDPGNFGTLTRTADALGAAAVIALPGTVDPWNPKAVRAAAGAAFRVPIVHAEPDALWHWLHGLGFTVYAAEADGMVVDGLAWPERTALIVGNEGAGLSPAMRDAADRVVAVPIRAGAESLNVAVAAGILLYLLTRRR